MTDAKIDINQASEETLAALPGVGRSKAQRIIQYRETTRPFTDIMELAAVRGISERMVRRFADLITVEATIPAEAQLVALPQEEADVAKHAEVDEAATTADPDADTGPLPLIPAIADEEAAAETPLMAAVRQEAEAEEVDEPAVVEASAVAEAEEIDEVETAVFTESDTADEDTAPLPDAPVRERPTPSPAAAAAAANQEAAQRRGRRAALFGAIGGAIGGVLLTLLVLYLINGSLNYAQANAALRQELIYTQATQEALAGELTALTSAVDTDLGTVNERLDTADSRLDQTDTAVNNLDSGLSQAQTDINSLYDTSEALDERLTGVAAAADTFNTFLNGLRDLLFDLQGPPAPVTPTATLTPTLPLTPTLTPTVTPTPIVTPTVDPDSEENDEVEADEDEEEEELVAPTPTPTPVPTRTPRPTATPIGSQSDG
jgi:competence ComEA-like helix-hairpin-helix protein